MTVFAIALLLVDKLKKKSVGCVAGDIGERGQSYGVNSKYWLIPAFVNNFTRVRIDIWTGNRLSPQLLQQLGIIDDLGRLWIRFHFRRCRLHRDVIFADRQLAIVERIDGELINPRWSCPWRKPFSPC